MTETFEHFVKIQVGALKYENLQAELDQPVWAFAVVVPGTDGTVFTWSLRPEFAHKFTTLAQLQDARIELEHPYLVFIQERYIIVQRKTKTIITETEL